jgi:FAD/FMN-containing dehydrogenase
VTDALASLVAMVRARRETGVPVTARGGGTSMAGNAVGRAARRVADRVHTFAGA